jgi:hypothetical protein
MHAVMEYEGVKLVCDPKSLLYLFGMELDYSDALVRHDTFSRFFCSSLFGSHTFMPLSFCALHTSCLSAEL